MLLRYGPFFVSGRDRGVGMDFPAVWGYAFLCNGNMRSYCVEVCVPIVRGYAFL